jgi:hypothetical protein
VRWELLFADLEAQVDAAAAAELAGEVEERTRHAVGAVTLVQRLRAAAGSELTVGLEAAAPAVGVVEGVGPDWLLLAAGGTELLVPTAAVAWVQGLGRLAQVTEPGRVWGRLGLRTALRGIARDRSVVTVRQRGVEPVTGTLDRVGADQVDLAVHAADEPRRVEHVRSVRTISLASLQVVARAG